MSACICGHALPQFHEVMGSPAEYFKHVHRIVIHFECPKCQRHGQYEVELEDTLVRKDDVL